LKEWGWPLAGADIGLRAGKPNRKYEALDMKNDIRKGSSGEVVARRFYLQLVNPEIGRHAICT
jgi:hypothetical protein